MLRINSKKLRQREKLCINLNFVRILCYYNFLRRDFFFFDICWYLDPTSTNPTRKNHARVAPRILTQWRIEFDIMPLPTQFQVCPYCKATPRDWMNRNNTLLFALHRILIFWFTIYFINSNKFLYKIFDYINWGKKILLYLLRLILRQENHQNRIMVHWKLHIHHFWCALEIRNNVSLFKKITFWVSAYC